MIVARRGSPGHVDAVVAASPRRVVRRVQAEIAIAFRVQANEVRRRTWVSLFSLVNHEPDLETAGLPQFLGELGIILVDRPRPDQDELRATVHRRRVSAPGSKPWHPSIAFFICDSSRYQGWDISVAAPLALLCEGPGDLKRLTRRMADAAEKALHVRILREDSAAVWPEAEFARILFEQLQPDCVFDVGANVGQYASALRESLGFAGTILSFEPNPAAFEKLSRASAGDAHWHCLP